MSVSRRLALLLALIFTSASHSTQIGNLNMAIWRISTCKAEAGYCSSSSLYNIIRDGLWTRPVQLAERSVGWPDNEVRTICAARIAGKSNGEIKELVNYLHALRQTKLEALLNETAEITS